VAEPAEPKPVPPVPADPALPQLARVLDGAALAGLLGQAGVAGVVEARPRYLRYKPTNKALVLHDVCLEGDWTHAVVTIAARRDLRKLLARPGLVALARRAGPRSATGVPLMYLEEPRALDEWYPFNRLLPNLAIEPNALQRWLPPPGASQGQPQPELLTYKPERRAVCRWGEAVLKFYARESDFEQAVGGLLMAGAIAGLASPPLLRSIPQARVTVQPFVQAERIPASRTWRARLGEALATVHRSSATSRWVVAPPDHLTEATRSAEHVTFLLPELADALENLLRQLHVTMPEPGALVPSHGDFHEDQAIVRSGVAVLLDFDHACLADPAYDVATFGAHWFQGEEDDRRQAAEALEHLLFGYGPSPPHLDWFLAVATLRRAAFPFRFLVQDWPARVRNLVEQARRIATRGLDL